MTKQEVLAVLDYRINMLRKGIDCLLDNSDPNSKELDYACCDHESRIDELESFRNYLRGQK